MNYNEEGALFVEQVKVATCMAGNRKTKSNIAGFLLRNIHINGRNCDGCAHPSIISNHNKSLHIVLLCDNFDSIFNERLAHDEKFT